MGGGGGGGGVGVFAMGWRGGRGRAEEGYRVFVFKGEG